MKTKTKEMTAGAPRISRESIDKLYSIREEMKTNKDRFRPTYEEIAQYINPTMADWSDTPPQESGAAPFSAENLYDKTVIKESNRLADGIQAYSFARNSDWMSLDPEDEDLKDNGEAKEYLQQIVQHNYSQLQKSNFYDEARTFIKSSADFGTGLMFRMNDPGRDIPAYKTLHLKRYFIAENIYGEVDTLYRDFFMTPTDAAEFFGKDRLPDQIVRAMEDNKQKQFLFTQIIFPVDKWNLDIQARQAGGMPFYSLYVADIDKFHAIREGGYYLKPFFTHRWSRSLDGDVWGDNCPGMIEIPNAKQLNITRKEFSRLQQLRVRPPMKATEGLRGRINLQPAGFTYLRKGEDYAPGVVAGDVTSLLEDIQDMRRQITESYYTDFFLILSQNVERQKTATEVAGLQGEKAAMMSAFFGRIASEFLEPVIEDLVECESIYGRLPPAPPSMRGRKIKVDLISPMAQMQKRYLALNRSQQALMEIAQVAALDPTILDGFDLLAHAQNIAEAYHMDKRVVRDMMDVQLIRKTRAQAQAQMLESQMKQQAATTGADVMQKTSKAPEEGSPAAQAMEKANAK